MCGFFKAKRFELFRHNNRQKYLYALEVKGGKIFFR